MSFPVLPQGAVIGTGQDEWYNMARAMQALCDYLNPSYFIHPAVYYELLAGLYGIHHFLFGSAGGLNGADYLGYFLANEHTLLNIARYLSVTFGALSVAASVYLAAMLGNKASGLLAGVFMACMPLLRSCSVTIRVDSAALFFLLVAVIVIVRTYGNFTRKGLSAASAAVGVAAAANYPGALALGLIAFLEFKRDSGLLPLREKMRNIVTACLAAFAVFLILNPYIVLELHRFMFWFGFQASTVLHTHPRGMEPTPVFYLSLLLEQGWPYLLAAAAGAAALFHRSVYVRGIAFYGVIYFAAFSFFNSQYDRFILPAFALLVCAGAVFITDSFSALSAVSRKLRLSVIAAAYCILLFGLFRSSAVNGRDDRLLPDYRADMFGYVCRNLPTDARLIYESDTIPLMQIIFGPYSGENSFGARLRRSFYSRFPRAPRYTRKAQYIAAVYNYDKELLNGNDVYVLSSDRTRMYIRANARRYPEAAAFYDELSARAAPVYQTGIIDETLTLYKVGKRAIR